MAYDDTQPTSKDRVRFLIGDTKATEIFSDNEITAQLAITPNPYDAAAELCLVVAMQKARQAVVFQVLGDELQVDKSKVAFEFRQLAKDLRAAAERVADGETSVWADGNIDALRNGFLVDGGLHDYEDTPTTGEE